MGRTSRRAPFGGMDGMLIHDHGIQMIKLTASSAKRS